jgi:hypothetical protein
MENTAGEDGKIVPFLQGFPRYSPAGGFVYVPDGDDGPLSQACTGAKVRLNERRPPWIVVDHQIESVIVARWPGRLFQVAIVDAEGVVQAGEQAPYTRAVEIEVCTEIPAARLFGKQGRRVCSILSHAGGLDVVDVQALARARHPDARKAFSRAWESWSAEINRKSDDQGRTAAAALGSGRIRQESPINWGFAVLNRVIRRRAESLVGSYAFLIDEDGERYLERTWASASIALAEAAMALGAPMFVRTDDRMVLSAAWRSVFGDTAE